MYRAGEASGDPYAGQEYGYQTSQPAAEATGSSQPPALGHLADLTISSKYGNDALEREYSDLMKTLGEYDTALKEQRDLNAYYAAYQAYPPSDLAKKAEDKVSATKAKYDSANSKYQARFDAMQRADKDILSAEQAHHKIRRRSGGRALADTGSSLGEIARQNVAASERNLQSTIRSIETNAGSTMSFQKSPVLQVQAYPTVLPSAGTFTSYPATMGPSQPTQYAATVVYDQQAQIQQAYDAQKKAQQEADAEREKARWAAYFPYGAGGWQG